MPKYPFSVVYIFLYMNRIVSVFSRISVEFGSHMGITNQRNPAFRCNATQRFSYQTFNQNQPVSSNSAGYKEVFAINEVHYREALPCDKFIIHQFSINRMFVRSFVSQVCN